MEKKKKISMFAHPGVNYIGSGLSLIMGIFAGLTQFYLLHYLLGVVIGFPFVYWTKFLLRKNIDNYVTFYTTPVIKRVFSKELQKFNLKTCFPIFIFIAITVILWTIEVISPLVLFGGCLWSFILAPEYKTIYRKTKDAVSNS